jgi:superfamily II DNA/RNA helicase
VPIHPDDYVHRIGRTGRAGRTGTAITMVAGSNDAKAVAAIEKLIGQTIPFMAQTNGERAAGEQVPAAAVEPQHQQKREPNRGRHEQQRRPERQPRQERPASVARIDDARPRRAPQPAPARNDDGDTSHLPAFLLRPVTLKA